jgi:small subunit ribosomal protein S6
MAKYEMMVLIDPFLEETDTQAMVEKAQEQIKRRGGNITHVDPWGKRRLAYPINKKLEGYYILISFDGELEGAAIAEAERTLRLDEKIMRVMVTRIPTLKARKAKKAKEGDANRGAETHSAGQAGQQPQGQR